MGINFIQIVRQEFDIKTKIHLKELYKTLSKNPDIELEPSKLKHRIRSALYSLQQQNQIKRIDRELYQKTGEM